MSNPWMKFYPSDWRSDAALRMCSIGARGLWMEMLCIMHSAEPRGALLVNGKPVSTAALASLAGVPAKEVPALLNELREMGVFSETDDGVILSRRIMRDEEKAKKDKANGKKGGNPRVKAGVNPPVNLNGNGAVKGGDKAQKPEARNQISPSHEEILPVSSMALGQDWDDAAPFPVERLS